MTLASFQKDCSPPCLCLHTNTRIFVSYFIHDGSTSIDASLMMDGTRCARVARSIRRRRRRPCQRGTLGHTRQRGTLAARHLARTIVLAPSYAAPHRWHAQVARMRQSAYDPCTHSIPPAQYLETGLALVVL